MLRIILLTMMSFCSITIFAQSVGIGSLFRPGLRLTANHFPATSDKELLSVESSQANLGLIIPLNGGASFDLKKLKAKAFQNFLLCNAGLRSVEATGWDKNINLYNFSLGLSGARLGVGSGLIAYTANVGVIQPLGDDGKARFFGMLGAMKIRVRGLGRQDFYGFGAVYANGRLLPVPIIGIRRKLTKRLHATVLLPVQANLTYSAKGGHRFMFNAVWGGFNTNIERPSILPNQASSWDFQVTRFKTGGIVNLKFSRNIRLLLEGGMNLYQRLHLEGRNAKVDSSPSPSPYVQVSLRMNMGKSLINAQLFGNDS